MPALIKWTDIQSFHNLTKSIGVLYSYSNETPPIITYQAKVKLHGTNAGVQISQDGEVVAQSHHRILSEEADNMQFHQWVMSNKEKWAILRDHERGPMTVFGEWCGKGIAKGTAISQLDRKILAVFAIQIGVDKAVFLTEPADISTFLKDLDVPDVYVLPWLETTNICDFSNINSVKSTVDWANNLVEQVEKCDPWVYKAFGIQGIGEGVVAYPTWLWDPIPPRGDITAFMFKAKGEAHRVVKDKKAAQVSPTSAVSVNAFIDLVLTEARLEQGVTEACNERYDTTLIGPFLKWIGGDVKKECQNELQVSNIEWKSVAGPLAKTAKEWYVKRIQEI